MTHPRIEWLKFEPGYRLRVAEPRTCSLAFTQDTGVHEPMTGFIDMDMHAVVMPERARRRIPMRAAPPVGPYMRRVAVHPDDGTIYTPELERWRSNPIDDYILALYAYVSALTPEPN